MSDRSDRCIVQKNNTVLQEYCALDLAKSNRKL